MIAVFNFLMSFHSHQRERFQLLTEAPENLIFFSFKLSTHL